MGNVRLQDDDRLLGQLASVKYRFISGGKKRIEDKPEYKKRVGYSPDDADCAVMAIYVIRKQLGDSVFEGAYADALPNVPQSWIKSGYYDGNEGLNSLATANEEIGIFE